MTRNKKRKAVPDIQYCRDEKGERVQAGRRHISAVLERKLKSLKEEALLLRCWAMYTVILNWQAMQMGSWHVSTCRIQISASLRDPVSLTTMNTGFQRLSWCLLPFKQHAPASSRGCFFPPTYFLNFCSRQLLSAPEPGSRHPHLPATQHWACPCQH